MRPDPQSCQAYQQSVLKLSSDEEQLVYLEVEPGTTASSMFRHALKNPADFDLFTLVPAGDDLEAEEHIWWVTASLRGWAVPIDRVQWNFKRYELHEFVSGGRGDGPKELKSSHANVKGKIVQNAQQWMCMKPVVGWKSFRRMRMSKVSS